MIRGLRPNNKSIPDPPKNEVRDRTEVLLRGRAEELLRVFHSQSGFTSVRDGLTKGIEGHRPTLVLPTFFSSTAEAERNAAGLLKIQKSVKASTSAARSLIDFAHDVYFKRYPDIRFDGSCATFLASACVTSLYDVFDSRTATQNVDSVFKTVEHGIQCLD
ncbi:uncharacterized protein KD926_002568 [Aspergillus affinis]|uniref:uncharacterized protein n=1 Tax=Aspergillus affinis TaxID=1070780 RepID=UPI0022FE7BD2|nr:uncharacterized protein KD926_002568 [Aspergillus affinis]KAI9035956.1 hypothetical protein KD926_002568 [Aspergillus affinis]